METTGYVYVHSADFSRDGSPFDMEVRMMQPFQIDSEKYEMALMEVAWMPKKVRKLDSDIYIMCDAIESSQAGKMLPSLLRVVDRPMAFPVPWYKGMSRNIVERMRIYVRNKEGEVPPLADRLTSLRLVLHIRMKGRRP